MSKGSSTAFVSSSIFGAGITTAGSIAMAYRRVLLVVAVELRAAVFVVGRTKELYDRVADWKAEAVLAHDIANSVVAWENFMVIVVWVDTFC
jgi:hypothetical protein